MDCLSELKRSLKIYALQKAIFRLYLWLGRIYTEEIAKAKESPSFEREYNLKYLGMIGNVFHTKDIEIPLDKGTNMNCLANIDEVNYYTQKIQGYRSRVWLFSFWSCCNTRCQINKSRYLKQKNTIALTLIKC